MSRYAAVLADPPWTFRVWSDDTGNGRAARAHYETQQTDWLSTLPVADVAAEDCVLFLWACWPTLPDALRLIESWGFEYKTLAFSWVKVTQDGRPRMGLGYWTRANTEPCLLVTRGKPKRLDKGVEQVLVSGLGDHSQKPDEQYSRIERLVSGPYLELFHRPRNGLFPPRPNWTFLGNEVDGKDIRDALQDLAQGERHATNTP